MVDTSKTAESVCVSSLQEFSVSQVHMGSRREGGGEGILIKCLEQPTTLDTQPELCMCLDL